MRHIRRVIVTALLFSMLIVPELAVATVSATTPNPLRPYIIMLQPNVDRAAFTRDLRQLNAGQVRYEYSSVFNGLVIDLPEAVAEMLATDGRVLGMSEDRPVAIDVQTTPAGISAIGATQSPIANINGVDERVNVDVAILDTGSGPHVDLNVAGGVSCMGGTYWDNNGHGTHVAGTVGAIDNTAGVVGVAPGARIWSVKVLDSSGNGTTSSAICGIDWVNANAGTIEVANMSLGAYYGAPPPTDNCGNYDADAFIEDPMHRAICNSVAAGVTYTVAAGNDSADARFYAPARYPEVITVSAINTSNWLFASFSNYGQVVDVAAPGVAVLSTVPGNGYQSWNGTSMATPHAAGAAALYLVANPGASPAAVRSALISTGNTTIWSGDRDAFKEPLINVSTFGGGTPTARDVEVTSLSATPSVTQGQTVNVSTQVRNNGTASETVSVTLNESPNGFTQNQSINLAAGATTTVNFNWATSTATTPGQHTLQVTATIPNDGNAANNSRSTATNVQQATSTSMSVTAVEMSNRQAKGQNLIDIRVRVESGGAPVSGATVNVLLTRPGGATNQLVGITNTTGYAFMTASTSGDGTYSAGVTNVTRSGHVYDPSGNVVSSASLSLGGGGSDPRDVEVVSISAPANVTQGDAVTVSAVVRNNGTASETFNVTLTETPNGFSQTQSVALGAAVSTTVTFTWQTSGATTPGNHTVTATATMSGDGNAANNARSATVNVQASGDGNSELYVSNITLSQVKTFVQGRVYIQSAGQNVSGATVSVELQLPSGSVVSASATTTVYGYAVFHWPLSGSGTYTVTVTNAAKSGYTYDPSQNIVSSRSITIT